MIDPVGGGVARGGESVTQRRGVCARERSCRGEIELGAPCDLVTDFTAELPSLLESRLFVTRHRGSGFSRWNSPAFVCGSREKHCKKGGTMGRPRSVRSVRTVRRGLRNGRHSIFLPIWIGGYEYRGLPPPAARFCNRSPRHFSLPFFRSFSFSRSKKM